MKFLKRLMGKFGLLAVLVLAVLGCYGIASEWPRVQPSSDAARPLPKLPGEVRGPTADEVIARLNRLGPKWMSPPDVIE